MKLEQNQENMSDKIRRIGNETEGGRLLNTFLTSDIKEAHVEAGDEKCCLPIYYENEAESLRKFEIREDDVLICAHPKTGTTWVQEMVYLLVNDLNYEKASAAILVVRFPKIEVPVMLNYNKIEKPWPEGSSYYDLLAHKLPSPRCLKSHLTWSLLPEQITNGTKNPKIISIVRNAQDVCISYFHYSRTYDGYKGNFEDFCTMFMEGKVTYGPYWKSVISYWDQRHRDNVLIIKYKDMKNDLMGVIKTVAKFLGKSYTDAQLEKLADHLSFESMKKNPHIVNDFHLNFAKKYNLSSEAQPFFRLGTEGGYKDAMNPEIIEKFRKWTEESVAGTGLELDSFFP